MLLLFPMLTAGPALHSVDDRLFSDNFDLATVLGFVPVHPSPPMAFDSVLRGVASRDEPRIPVKKAETPAKKRGGSPAVARAGSPAAAKRTQKKSYGEIVAAIEASVSNPPPTEMGSTTDGVAWLKENSNKEGVVTLPCGLQYLELARSKNPNAKSPKLNTPVELNYRGFLLDGTEFDSSYERGQSFTFVPKDMIQASHFPLQTPHARDASDPNSLGHRWCDYDGTFPPPSHLRACGLTSAGVDHCDAAHGRGRRMGNLLPRRTRLW